ncbi:hypothetical protein [uncultured Paraglaciecola sp.]|uniref:hypothetical protein n=1 Tax=uncultured Paraglaciecola sp. TaxID=1765024 RepID=UPI002628BD3A|nr:hypothetical protein [uncultured Paraglaciecola sp.]
MKLFNRDNTEGYTAEELAGLNSEWEKIVESEGLEEFTEEYDFAAKTFSDKVANR